MTEVGFALFICNSNDVFLRIRIFPNVSRNRHILASIVLSFVNRIGKPCANVSKMTVVGLMLWNSVSALVAHNVFGITYFDRYNGPIGILYHIFANQKMWLPNHTWSGMEGCLFKNQSVIYTICRNFYTFSPLRIVAKLKKLPRNSRWIPRYLKPCFVVTVR